MLNEVVEKGTWKDPARGNMPPTLSRFGIMKRFDLREGFPLLTTKQMFYKGVIHELIWFLKGDTNIYYLHKNGVKKMWHEDAYKWYVKKLAKDDTHVRTFEEWCEALDDEQYALRFGDLGKIYSYQWRHFGSGIQVEGSNQAVFYPGTDQIQKLVDNIKEKPYERYKVVSAWNPVEVNDAALPPCHMLFQFNCRPMTASQREDYYAKVQGMTDEQRGEMNPNDTDDHVHILMDEAGIPRFYLDCEVIIRSNDLFLGAPFNIASYALLIMIMAKLTNTVAGDLVYVANDAHIYENHMEQVKLQLSREPKKLPKMVIGGNWSTVDDIKFEDFELVDYEYHPKIEGKLSTGLR